MATISIHASIHASIMCFIFSSSSVHQLLQLIDPCCWEITIPLLHVQYSCPLTHSCPGFNSPFNESTYSGETQVIASTESPSHVLPPDPGIRSSTCSGPPHPSLFHSRQDLTQNLGLPLPSSPPAWSLLSVGLQEPTTVPHFILFKIRFCT